MAESREKQIQTLIVKQPAFDTKEQAVSAALKLIEQKKDYPEIWRDPKGEKFLVANYKAYEQLYRKGYKRSVRTDELVDMLRTDEIEEV